MKKMVLPFLLYLSIFFSLIAKAEEKEKGSEVRFYPGMETIKVGDVNVLVPKGSKLRHENDLLVIESAEEYAAPNIIEINRRIETLEKKQTELENTVETLERCSRLTSQ